MGSAPVSQEEFFSQLVELFNSQRTAAKGSVFLTQKRYSYGLTSDESMASKMAEDKMWDVKVEQPLPVLVRATNGAPRQHRVPGQTKVKISTLVQPDELAAFYGRYAEVCKSSMSALKKRERKKKRTKKKRAKADASKKP